MSKSPGKCVFCGGPGLTKSHIWAAWVERLMNISDSLPSEHSITFNDFIDPAQSRPEKRSSRQGSNLKRKPRNTCGACNGGWMSSIENSAIPFATPLILGKNCLIDTF